jgi:predicted aspartyl protease
MGHRHKRVKVSGDKAATVLMLVDTGAAYSVLPEALARTIGITTVVLSG